MEMLESITVRELSDLVDEESVRVLDVRQPAEWASGHIDGATFITGAELPERAHEIPSDRPVAVVCGSGYRSSISASLLQQRGTKKAMNVIGGMSAWRSARLPVTPPEPVR
jgi:hydroxyacylglutathione hydrolase